MELVPPNRKKMTKYTGSTQDLLTQKSSKYGTSWALTSSTMSSLQTSSTPSLEDGLRFLRSCKVPLFLNFLRSLYRDLLEAGGGALATPHVGAAHLMMRMRQEKEKELAITCEHIQLRSVPGQPPASSSPPKMCAGPQSIPLPF